jgi:Hypothetical glycosyl hydrolase family 15
VAVFVTFNDGSNPAPPPALPAITATLDDSWDWDQELAPEDEYETELAFLGPNLVLLPSLAIEDAWDWDAEGAPDDEYDSDYLPIANLVLLAALTPDDQWEWESDRAPEDEYDSDFNPNVNKPSLPGFTHDDDEVHVEGEPEDDFFDHFGNIDALQPIYEDAWDWDAEQAPEEDDASNIAFDNTPLNFPLLGGYIIGGSVQSFTVAQAAALDVMIGASSSWLSGEYNVGQFAAAARAINPNFVLFNYSVPETVSTGNPPNGNSALADIISVPWYLYDAGTSGTIVTGDNGYITNTATASKQLSGQTYSQWRAGVDNTQLVSPYASYAGFAGVYVDNFYSTPRKSGDWLLLGSSQSVTPPSSTLLTAYQNGNVSYCTALRALTGPNQQMITGNVADWYTNLVGTIPANITNYIGVLNGGVLESIQGQESVSWLRLMADYSTIMAAFAAPAYGIFSYDGTQTNYQGFRYFFCSCLLHNGYFTCTEAGFYNGYYTFDEYSFNLGAPIPGPNNPSNGVYGSGLTVYQNGVWRRDFVNGIALVNPRGNGVRTLTLETTYYRLTGSQDPSVNSGVSTATTPVTLQDAGTAGTGGDAIILSRTPT